MHYNIRSSALFLTGIIVIIISISFLPNVAALSISTDKETYYFGDHLTFIIQVEEIKEQFATMWIIDETGKSSSAINIPITELSMSITSPFPFESITYPVGTYTLDIEYNDEKASTQFDLQDSGRIIIPVWIKDVAKMWTDDLIAGEQFTTAIEFLIQQEIIIIPINNESGGEENSEIPQWVKTNAKWWADGLIDDNTFALGLQHLIKIGVILV